MADVDTAAAAAAAAASAAVNKFHAGLMDHDVELLFRDGHKLYAHRFVLRNLSTLGVMFEIEPQKNLIDLQECPAEVTREGVAGLLCFMYSDILIEGAPAAARATPMYLVEAAADYLGASKHLKDALWWKNVCRCCMKNTALEKRDMCEKCWKAAGDARPSPLEPMVPTTYAKLLGVEIVPESSVRAMIEACTTTKQRTCVEFARIVESFMQKTQQRLTTDQSKRLQAAMKLHTGSPWCAYAEIGIHNLMFQPGTYEPPRECSSIHCYLGFKDEKNRSLRQGLSRATGDVPHANRTSQENGIYQHIAGNFFNSIIRCDACRAHAR